MKKIIFFLIVLSMLSVSHCSDYPYPTGSTGYLTKYQSPNRVSNIYREFELMELAGASASSSIGRAIAKAVDSALEKKGLSYMQTQIYDLQTQMYELQTEVSKLKTDIKALNVEKKINTLTSLKNREEK